MKNKILIFVPGYNVSKTILQVIKNLIKLEKKLNFDVIYVDNKSSDKSAELVKQFIKSRNLSNISIIKNKVNKGYGGSQKVAFRYAFRNKYDHLIEYDGDLQYPYEPLLDLYNKSISKNASIVFGSRVTNKNNLKEMPIWKQLGNKFLNSLNNWSFNFGVSEIHTAFRIYDLNKIKGFNLESCHNDYRWTIDSVVEIIKLNDNLSEIPISCFYHENASAPNLKELLRVTSYMVIRGIRFKLFRY